VWITSSLATVLTPTAVALGNFDGIHRGHRRVIQPVLDGTLATSKGTAIIPTVVTFNPHPHEFFSGQPRQLLTPVGEKVQQLQEMGIQQLVRLPFNRALANLSPEEFVAKILVQHLQVTRISVGADFCFGRSRSGTAPDLQALAAREGIEVVIVPLKLRDGDRISSSAIRTALQAGDLAIANQLLGRAYSLVGSVVPGKQLGRTLGFPTANLHLPPEKFLPHWGVYAVRVQIFPSPTDSASPEILGVLNIGVRPTVDGQTQSAEVHLLDWSADLYGKTLGVKLEQFIRPEQKFASVEALKQQIQADCALARQILEAA
jgi:riboflavin kinase / FMN adenylyltransferase